MAHKIWDLKKYGKQEAFMSDSGESLTYKELHDKSGELAESFESRGIVFALCSNTIGSVFGYVSMVNHGIIPVLLNKNMEKRLFEDLIDNYQPPYLWIPGDMEPSLLEYGIDKYEVVYHAFDYVLVKTSYSACDIFEELGLLLTTSGSTGSPKFVRQSYANIVSNAESIAGYLELDEHEKPITTLPMNYTYGLSIINSHLLTGACILLTEKTLMQKQFWEFFKESGATSIGGVPYTYEILDKLGLYRMQLPTLKTMTQAGGKLAPELHKKLAEYASETNRQFVVMYGQCEATARMGYLPYQKSLEKYGSMGIAIPGGTLSIIDTEGNVIEESDKVGELVYEGSNVTLGYAECREDLAKGDERHGKLFTGDMAKRDEDGYFYIVGRKKRFLKIFGNRVNLDEIDRMIKAEFNGTDCASTGIDDHMCIYITEEALCNKVKKFIVEKTKLNASAFHVEAIEQIPKNDAGKTLYKDLPVRF